MPFLLVKKKKRWGEHTRLPDTFLSLITVGLFFFFTNYGHNCWDQFFKEGCTIKERERKKLASRDYGLRTELGKKQKQKPTTINALN